MPSITARKASQALTVLIRLVAVVPHLVSAEDWVALAEAQLSLEGRQRARQTLANLKGRPLSASQLALPDDACRAVYASEGYASRANAPSPRTARTRTTTAPPATVGSSAMRVRVGWVRRPWKGGECTTEPRDIPVVPPVHDWGSTGGLVRLRHLSPARHTAPTGARAQEGVVIIHPGARTMCHLS